MKKIFLVFSLLAALVPALGRTENSTAPKTDRRGFFLGLDAGGGGNYFSDKKNRGAFTGGLVIGGGLNEKILLMYEDSASIGLAKTTPTVGEGLFAAQFFLTSNYYVRPGIGFGSAETSSGTVTTATDIGFAAGLAAGYEFRLSKRFALSPEVKGHFLRAQGVNYYDYGVVADMRWYF